MTVARRVSGLDAAAVVGVAPVVDPVEASAPTPTSCAGGLEVAEDMILCI